MQKLKECSDEWRESKPIEEIVQVVIDWTLWEDFLKKVKVQKNLVQPLQSSIGLMTKSDVLLQHLINTQRNCQKIARKDSGRHSIATLTMPDFEGEEDEFVSFD